MDRSFCSLKFAGLCLLFLLVLSMVSCNDTRMDDRAGLLNVTKVTNAVETGPKASVTSADKADNVPDNSTSTSSTCTLSLSEPHIIDLINGYFSTGTKLLRYNIQIEGDTGQILHTDNGSQFEPTKWILTNSPAGKSLLLLKDYFNAMSLTTMGYGTEEVTVKLTQTPNNCLANIAETGDGYEARIRRGIFRSFGSSESMLSLGIKACNRHIVNISSDVGTIRYRCCEEMLDGSVNCEDVTESIWLILLFNTIAFLQILIVLFSPKLVPSTAVRVSNAFVPYLHTPKRDTLSFKVTVLDVDQNEGDDFITANKRHSASMIKFKRTIHNLHPGRIYKMYVEQLHLLVKANNILPEGYVPVGLFTFLNNFIFSCGLRHDVDAAKVCCKTNMLNKCRCGKGVIVPWYKFGTAVASCVLPFLLLSPWILRIWFYYSIEDGVVRAKRNAMISRNLHLASSGSLTLDWSPFSKLFLATYIMVAVEIVLYNFMPRRIQRRLKFTIKQCFRDMQSTDPSKVCSQFTEYICQPFISYGVLGCLFLPLILTVLAPVLFVILMCRTLPIMDVSFRMLTNCLYNILKVFYPETLEALTPSKDGGFLKLLYHHLEKVFGKVIVEDVETYKKRRNKMIYAFSLAACLVTMWLTLLIVTECITFYVECAVYTLTGIILNSGRVMKHVTLVMVVGYYGYDCASSVYGVYLTFNKTINKEIQKVAPTDEVKRVAQLPEDEQPNTAFVVEVEDDEPVSDQDAEHGDDNVLEKETSLRFSTEQYGFFQVCVDKMLFFLTSGDVPLIPRQFLMEIAQEHHFACPKKPHVLYFRALLDFLSILLFLMFVFIVIFAFGQANNVSSANQALAALGGGFLPLVFRKFLFKSHDSPQLDTGNIAWTTTFKDAVTKSKCFWDIEDIVIQEESTTEIRVDHRMDHMTIYDEEDDLAMGLLGGQKADRGEITFKVRLDSRRTRKLEDMPLELFVKQDCQVDDV